MKAVELVYEWMGHIQLGVFLLAPLLLPWWLKRYIWLGFVAVGYVLYIAWGLYLQVMGTMEEFGTGFGMMILPYLAGISLFGYLLQKSIDHAKQNGSEE
ncbi:hypothetical protein AUC31_15545 [Planococcus rifietoensis]|uniref:Uncharacterized protein n=1 Tax=Planococcus rifietoensis TaxID=200991 RepID=A0A0U2XTT7_9BACL|nr:hypothetical protein AUC31_15545 [Planococcus rifietoensis]